eukprot:NODE_5121_length_716_cov_219.098951_g4754_i0.p2 GENE.NODE_5121_length_716_cov_219.098951_g4754_i0~~NODE_5121_length_716_cov_219.098951_g4754_i0.p2  ORF type:complete len:183 (+),score=54.81 NODE_5121_length_716_cov_219.098951_g4754_i0:74-550(+)
MSILEKATEFNGKLNDAYFNGKAPGDADIKAFEEIFGKDHVHLWRWAKHIASFPEAERAAWQPPQKTALVAKSSIILDIKPWDDETDMVELERCVRAIELNGLHWGMSKLVPVAFGVKKMQIVLSIVDDLVSSDDIEEAIMSLEDYVQSMDVVAWNKL